MQTTPTNPSCRSLFARRSLAACAMLATVITVSYPVPQAIGKVFSGDLIDEKAVGEAKDNQRLREGTQVEKLAGHFKLTGDRVTFFASDGKQRLGGLENLALERVARTVKDSPTQLHWVVTGVITEYRGTNYLLVTHAMLAEEGQGLVGR